MIKPFYSSSSIGSMLIVIAVVKITRLHDRIDTRTLFIALPFFLLASLSVSAIGN